LGLVTNIATLVNAEDEDTREKAELFLVEFLDNFKEVENRDLISHPVKERMKILLGGENVSDFQEEINHLKEILRRIGK